MTDPTDLLAQNMFPLSADDTPWRKLEGLDVEKTSFEDHEILKVTPE